MFLWSALISMDEKNHRSANYCHTGFNYSVILTEQLPVFSQQYFFTSCCPVHSFHRNSQIFFFNCCKRKKEKKNLLPPQQLLQFSDGSSNLPAFVQDVSIRMVMKRGEMESFNCWILQRKQWEELARVRSSEICCLQWFKVENVLSKIRERCDFHLFYYCCSCYLFEAHFILFLGSTVFPVSSNQLSWTV